MTEQVGGHREADEASVQSSYVSEPADRGRRNAKRHACARGVFVTGTGTEVGKTVVAAAIARTLAGLPPTGPQNGGRSSRVAVFKPVVTGLEEAPADADGISGPVASGDECAADPAAGLLPHIASREAARQPDHEVLRRAAGSAQSDAEIAPYRFGPAVSPHLAAELAGKEIDPARLREGARVAASSADVLVCEGVGGLLVPLTSTYSVRDFAVDLGLPLVIAASPGLGTINHTLLTIEAARAVGLEVATVILTPWPERPNAIEESNRETIAELGEVEVQVLQHLDLDEPEAWPELRSLATLLRYAK